MKNLLRLLPFLGIAILLKACSFKPTDEFLPTALNAESTPPEPCVNDNPITRIVNNGTIAVALSVRDENGAELVNFHYVAPNSTTSWESFNPGLHIFYLTDFNATANTSFDKATIQMDNCMALEIEIDSNNEVVSFNPTSL